jgi:DNA helicase-4
MPVLPIILTVVAIIGFAVFRRQATRKKLLQYLDKEQQLLTEFREYLQNLRKGENYVRKALIQELTGRLQSLDSIKMTRKLRPPRDHPSAEVIGEVHDYLRDPMAVQSEINEGYIQREIEHWSGLFSSIEEHPLNAEQARAVVVNEKNNILVAGAGTGKTSTIIARTAYILRKGLAKEEQILMLAYGRDAAEVMRTRIKERTGYDVTVKTFHALGLEIVNACNEGPSPAVFGGDNLQQIRLMQTLIDEVSKEETIRTLLVNFFANHLRPFRDEFSFKNHGEYNEYLRQNNLRTLNGEPVKSYGELTIANFLFCNGIEYNYESRYPHDPKGGDVSRAYQPDFTIAVPTEDGGREVYIEYWGLDRNGNTRKGIDRKEYKKSMEWKKATHRANGTTLIELSYADVQNNILKQHLVEQLSEHGIPLTPVDSKQLFDRVRSDSNITDFSKLVLPVLGYARANNFSVDDLAKKVNGVFVGIEEGRARAFLEVFRPISLAYAHHLQEKGGVDFDEMIGRATEYARSGEYSSPYTHILVDEFQDISQARANLVKALKDQRDDTTFFCVGDDWQSIFRFAGSDIHLMTDFESYFGDSSSNILDQTFRFNDKIAEVSGGFVMRNPSQLRKQLKPLSNVDEPRVFLVSDSNAANEEPLIGKALEHISKISKKDGETVYVIGRYSLRNRPELQRAIQRQCPERLTVSYKTAHKSKGGEASHVIIVDMIKGRRGFPCEIQDDPLLNLVLAKPEEFEHAEERRLFYVALTRAKESVHVIVPAENKSPFIEELLTPPADCHYEVEMLGEADVRSKINCPICEEGGHLVKWQGEYDLEPHMQCSNYPYCDYKDRQRCDKPYCGGYMKKKKGKYGLFWGCTNYRQDGTGCDNTKKIKE